MRILITGMAGFIGHQSARSLHADGHEILGVDNLNSYYLPRLKQARVDDLQQHGRIAFRKCDLADHDALSAVFRSFAPELVLHLAAQAGVRYSLENPHAYIQSNIVGTLNILECCRNHGKPRLVYASSSSVYGGSTDLPYSEDHMIDRPISLYAATKKSNELMAHTYAHLYGLKTTGLRFFTVYGPWGRPDMAMWLFTDAILHNRPIKVFNRGDMYRDFTFIDDTVAGIKACLLLKDPKPYEVFNLGNHRSEKLGLLIDLIETTLGRKAERILLPMQPGDVKETWADISRARARLGFNPSTTLRQGVPRFIEWYLAHPEFHPAG